MTRSPVRIGLRSTALAAATYHESQSALTVEFFQGAVYLYHGVPRGIYRDLLQAPSQGAYFNQNIRKRFPHEKVPSGEN